MTNKSKQRPSFLWMPLAIAIAVVIGLFVGSRFGGRRLVAENDRKLNTLLNLIADDYVDTVNLDQLIEMSIPQILANLDPHTTYFSAEDMRAANEELSGSFSGIGISFMLLGDTINVVEVIPGGPAEKVGILAGDRIIEIDDSLFVGPKVTNGEVMKNLRGEKNTKVKLGVKRNTAKETLHFTVTRGDIPVKSVDAAYMIDKTTGYVKVNQFGRTTYDEFITALTLLKAEGNGGAHGE